MRTSQDGHVGWLVTYCTESGPKRTVNLYNLLGGNSRPEFEGVNILSINANKFPLLVEQL